MFIRWDKGKNKTFYLKLASSYRHKGGVRQDIFYLGRIRLRNEKIFFSYDKLKINIKLMRISKFLDYPLDHLEKKLFTGKSKFLKINNKDKKDSPHAYKRYISQKRTFILPKKDG